MSILRIKDPITGEWREVTVIRGPKGEDGNVSFDELTPEQKEELRGPRGEVGAEGPAGKDGETPERGVDYWTEADIQAIKDYIDQQLEVIENGSY